ESAIELAAAAGLETPHHITRSHLSRRVFMNQVKTFEEIYPSTEVGALLNAETIEKISIDNW
ncbi:MAG: Glutamate synthase, partial [Bacteroidetes bacterium]|nr:Glutamate synthase [Bacteroidota bacterium]